MKIFEIGRQCLAQARATLITFQFVAATSEHFIFPIEKRFEWRCLLNTFLQNANGFRILQWGGCKLQFGIIQYYKEIVSNI